MAELQSILDYLFDKFDTCNDIISVLQKHMCKDGNTSICEYDEVRALIKQFSKKPPYICLYNNYEMTTQSYFDVYVKGTIIKMYNFDVEYELNVRQKGCWTTNKFAKEQEGRYKAFIINILQLIDDDKKADEKKADDKKADEKKADVKKKKRSISATVKRLVWNINIGETIGKSKCMCCLCTDITQMSFNCGHIIAEVNGGETIVSNLKPVCQNCNSSMGTKNMEEFMKSLI